MRGNIDLVTQEGLVEGWCWNESLPEARVSVLIRVNGEECGRTVACHFRKDLQDAGIGDGWHYFRLLLPDTILRHRRSQKVTLVDVETGKDIGEPFAVRFEYGLRFDDRINELEARSQLIESRIKEMAEVSAQRNASAELFAIVGAFFQRLSDDVAKGMISAPDLQLAEAIRAKTSALAPVAFPASIDTKITVFVEANCSLIQLYDCLTALRRAAASIDVRIIILDPGSYEDASLICSVVHGVQYLRTAGDAVAEWRQAGAGDPSPILLFLSGYSVVDEAFLAAVRDHIELNSHVGAVGGWSLGLDGRLHQAGFCIAEGQLMDCNVGRDPSLDSDPEAALSLHALSHVAVAFRRKALEAVDGLDLMFGDELWAAVIDLCFRMRMRGWSISSQKEALFALSIGKDAPSTTSSLATPSRARDLLLHRWVLAPDAVSMSFTGNAAVVGQLDRADEEMDAVRRLQTAGFSVHYLAADRADTSTIAAFQREGAHILLNAESLSDIPTRIIFTATENSGIERFDQEVKAGAQLVTGLPSLVSALRYHGDASLASPNA